MQLHDVREKYTIKEISYHTKISETSLEKIFEKDFESIRKPQAFGFISIIEREYKADLSELHEEATQYYSQFTPERTKHLGISTSARHERKEKSRGFSILIILLLTYATWYFLTQFDKKHLSELFPFIDEDKVEQVISNPEKTPSIEASLDIGKMAEEEEVKKEETTKPSVIVVKEEVKEEIKEVEVEIKEVEAVKTEDTINVEDNKSIEKEESTVKTMVSIIPKNRLWFGLIDKSSKKRDHFSVADTYALDVSSKTWLVATSSASFSLKLGEKTEVFKDNQEHYFSINKDEIKSLTKNEYVALGGWDQW